MSCVSYHRSSCRATSQSRSVSAILSSLAAASTAAFSSGRIESADVPFSRVMRQRFSALAIGFFAIAYSAAGSNASPGPCNGRTNPIWVHGQQLPPSAAHAVNAADGPAGLDGRLASQDARGAPNLTPYGSVRGLSPAFEITGAASDDARKRIRALAAAGSRTLLVSAPAKKIVG